MGELICGGLLTLSAALIVVNATAGRVVGFHAPLSRDSSVIDELALSGFMGSIGLGIATDAPVFILTALPCWIVGAVCQSCANARFRAEEEALRKTNAKKYPGIFDVDPPMVLDGRCVEVDLYDCGACEYLGRVSRDEIVRLIGQHVEWNEDANDLFFIEDMLDDSFDYEIGAATKGLLQDYFRQRDYVVLRWIGVNDDCVYVTQSRCEQFDMRQVELR